MKFSTSALGRFIASAVLLTAFALWSPAAFAADSTGELDFVKEWVGEALQPESVTLYLKSGGQIVSTLTISADHALPDGTWAGSFEDVALYDAQGNVIQYSVDEQPIAGWELSVTQLPMAETLRIKSWGEKVTPASEQSYSIAQANMLAANKGGSYYVWTRDALSEAQKSRLIHEINAAGPEGFGKELSLENTDFAAGLPAAFEGGVSLRQDGQRTFVDFESTNVWSLFYTGSIELTQAREARLINRAASVQPTPDPSPSPTATPVPTATATPSPVVSPSPSVQPSPPPSEPPKTGDTGISGVAAALVLSLGAAGLILWKLRKG